MYNDAIWPHQYDDYHDLASPPFQKRQNTAEVLA
jgi:hypothetical protein